MKRAPTPPRYVLSLDELPSVVEADDRVHPVYMKTRDVARIFDTSEYMIQRWVHENDLPAILVGSRFYISVGALKEWIEERKALFQQAQQEWAVEPEAPPLTQQHAPQNDQHDDQGQPEPPPMPARAIF